MTKAIEASQRVGSVRRIGGFHQRHTPKPVCMVDPDLLAMAAITILEHVKANQRGQGAGSYLFVDHTMNAFVISDAKTIAPQWVKERFAWLVGFYTTVKPKDPRIPTLKPSVAGFVEDIADHLRDLARVRP